MKYAILPTTLLLICCLIAIQPINSKDPGQSPPCLDEKANQPFRPLPVFDGSKISISQFSDEELELPAYLAHFGKLAASVVEKGPERGYIKLPVWRSPSKPFNARVMENILSMSFFYTSNRPWNIYYGSEGLRDRLEASLRYWLSLPSSEGAFPEYGPGEYNIAATAFGSLFMAQAIRLLKKGPAIDNSLYQRVRAAERKAILYLLKTESFHNGGTNYANQYSAMWVPAYNWISSEKDPEIEAMVKKRILEAGNKLQSPAGYFYEAGGPDWAYTNGTHFNNTANVLHLSKDPAIRRQIMEEEERYIDWLSYNTVFYKGKWMLNAAVECRSLASAVIWSDGMPQGEHIPLARAFMKSVEEDKQQKAALRKKLEQTWPSVDSLRSYNPRVFVYLGIHQWLPTLKEREAAVAKVPVNARQSFIQQRTDSRYPITYTYIRRPAYYATFAGGKQITKMQRLGLGLLWGKDFLMQSNSSGQHSWGTRAANSSIVYEAGDIKVTYSTGEPVAGIKELEAANIRIEYPLGDKGNKKIEFGGNIITVTVIHPGEFTEHIPASHPASVYVENKSVESLPLKGYDRLVYTIRF